ncbi:phospholipase D family protein [Primorskyibacter sp. S87]|uniref:phospholipase D family protein n=1 Tax=Primorskyibacter sp. S87 TaxID=3415126 RepID=UPI003C7D6540
MKNVRNAAFTGVLCLLAACTYVPFDTPREPSKALSAAGTRNARAALDLAGPGPSSVAIAPLVDGNDALGARLRMIAEAERSIDLKTFLIKPDIAGTLIWVALYDAAERGVKVRLLFDDVFTTAKDDEIATLDAHPNVEIRVFNPLSRNSTLVGNFLLDFSRVNRRMHNKAMITDGLLAIVGGRNIADEYYQINASHEFADFDLFVAGQPVAELSNAFDLYWNDQWSLPLSVFETGDETLLRDALAKFRNRSESEEAEIYRRAVNSTYLAALREGRVPSFPGQAHVVVDQPGKLRNPPGKGPFEVGESLYQTLGRARRDVLLITPYFVPEAYGSAFFRSLSERGVRVRVMTNSLASTNHPYVHGGYAPYRAELLDAGVELYEVRADATRLLAGLDAPLTMHTKLAIVDGLTVFVGSPNVDPRSIRQNSEIGMVIDSPELARSIVADIAKVRADVTFRVERTPDGGMRWYYEGQSGAQVFETEPGASMWRRIVARVTSWLPVEQQL